MTLEEYNAFCATLPCAEHVVQWRGAHVWKVGGKVFAIAGQESDGASGIPYVTFKAGELAYEILSQQPGLIPAPYLASRGMKWIQRRTKQSMDDSALRDYLRRSHALVSRGLPKRERSRLGL